MGKKAAKAVSAPPAAADTILKELVGIRVARRAKFVPYDLERRFKRREKDLWEFAEKLVSEQQQPPPTRPAEAA